MLLGTVYCQLVGINFGQLLRKALKGCIDTDNVWLILNKKRIKFCIQRVTTKTEKISELMGRKIKFEDKEYEVEDLSDGSKAALASLDFVTKRIEELSNLQVLLQRAKRSYIDSLKQEILSKKAGFSFEDE